MGTFRSNLPLGTGDPTVFVEGNVPNFDEAVNSQNPTWTDRFGVNRLTLAGHGVKFDNQLASQSDQLDSFLDVSNTTFQNFLASSGYSGWDVQYAAGIVLNSHNQGFTRCEPDETACLFYTPRGDTTLPYTTTGDWTSESSLFVVRGDDSLRQDLANPAKGTDLVSFSIPGLGLPGLSQTKVNENSPSLSMFFAFPGEDPFYALKRAAAFAKSKGGSDIFVEPGHYKTISRPQQDPESWVEIDFSGFRLWANPGTVVFENFLIYAHGEYGDPVGIGDQTIFSGTTTVKTSVDMGLAFGDKVQVLSQLNPYTPDAGDWQMGSKNPTTLETPSCRFSEIKTVSDIVGPQEFTVLEPFLYDNYKNNTSGQSHPLPGVSSAEVRKIDFVEGIIFYGINFKNVEVSSFRGILFRAVQNSFFIECGWEADTQPGRHFACTDSSNVGFLHVKSHRKPLNPVGSSWNSFIIGGGSENIYFENATLTGEQQAIDVTPNMLAPDPGATVDAIRAGYLTTQHVNMLNSLGRGCADMFTSHPATYGINVINCDAIGGSTGFRIRSRGSKVIGCRTYTSSGGLSLSAYHDDTVVYGNFFENSDGSVWNGVSVAPLSSEIMNSNTTKNVRIFGNVYKDKTKSPGNAGILFRMAGNGEPDNPEFDLFTDAVKAGMSGYYITDEYFSGCSLVSERFINGIFVKKCSFGDGTGRSEYIVARNGTATHTYDDNEFRDNLKNAASLGRHWSRLPYPVNPGHRLGTFKGWEGPPVVTTESDRGGTVNPGNLVYSGISLLNGTGAKSLRATGAATLRLDSVPLDGVSDSSIRVFEQSQTTGNKTLSVHGRIESHNSYPAQTNAYTSGLPSRAWAGGFTQSSFTVTSDERHKVHQPIGDAVLRAWAKVEYCQFKFKDRIEQKGDGARWHFGLLAQQVKAAFESEGLDAFEYGLLCFDEWDELPEIKDEDGNIIQEHRAAGDKYGIRYEEALALECAYLRSKL